MQYKCIRDMEIEKYDRDWYSTGEFCIVPEGSIWEVIDCNNIGGEIHLEPISELDDLAWIEINKESLKEYFKEVSK